MARPERWALPRAVGRRSSSALAVVVLVALVFGACAGGTTDATSTSAPLAFGLDRPGAELPEGLGLVAEERDGTRTVTSAWGSVTVPTDPKRIVSVEGDIDFEAMLALGVRPVGAGTPHGRAGEPFAPNVAALASGVKPLAWADGVPVAEIAKLRPDLIFVPDEDTADRLADIAPTVPRGSWVGTDWKQNFRYIAAVLGKGEAAADQLASWERRADRVHASIADQMEGRTVASPKLTDDPADVRVDSRHAFSSAVLVEVGLELAPVVLRADEDSDGVPLQELGGLDADVLFWQVRRDAGGVVNAGTLPSARSNPVWASLPAVRSQSVYEVDDRPWELPTILGAQRILDDVEQALA
jgi:iron complex transport system substrate-binding protein